MNRPNEHWERTKEYARILIPALRYVAYRHGYCLAVHGSLRHDIDLVAAPWRDLATSQESLAKEMRKACEAIIGFAHENEGENPTKKPYGRLAWSFHLGGGPYIDLSVFPPIKETSGTQNTKEKK